MRPLRVASLALVVACGAVPAGGLGPAQVARLTPPLRALHETLAPVRSEARGPGRITRACAASKEIVEKAAGVGDSSLTAHARSLDAECDDPLRDEVDTWLEKLVRRFDELAAS